MYMPEFSKVLHKIRNWDSLIMLSLRVFVILALAASDVYAGQCPKRSCGQGEGDCDRDSDCLEGLVCDFDWCGEMIIVKQDQTLLTILGAPGEILVSVQYNAELMELKNDSDTAILLPMEDTLAPLKCNQIAKIVTTDHVQLMADGVNGQNGASVQYHAVELITPELGYVIVPLLHTGVLTVLVMHLKLEDAAKTLVQ